LARFSTDLRTPRGGADFDHRPDPDAASYLQYICPPSDRELRMETNMPTVHVSVMRCDPKQFAEFRKMMVESITVLEPGIRQMRGLVHLYTGEDEAVSSLAQVSVWRTLEDAKQLDTFQPMLDLGKVFTSEGATFERPIMNYVSLWEIAPPEA
jgi:hypothetical protein